MRYEEIKEKWGHLHIFGVVKLGHSGWEYDSHLTFSEATKLVKWYAVVGFSYARITLEVFDH